MSRRRAAIDFTTAMVDVHAIVRSIRRRTDIENDDNESSEGEYLDEADLRTHETLEPRAKRPHLGRRRRRTRAAEHDDDEPENENENENSNEKGNRRCASSSPPPASASTVAEAASPAYYGNDLPGGVLLQIFSKLPLHDRRQASFTCRQWSRYAWDYAALDKAVDLSHITLDSRKSRNINVMDPDTSRQRKRLQQVLGKHTTEVALHDSLATPTFIRFLYRRCPGLRRLFIVDRTLSDFHAPSLRARARICARPTAARASQMHFEPSGVVLMPPPSITELHMNAIWQSVQWAGPPLPNLKRLVLYSSSDIDFLPAEALAFVVKRCTALEHVTMQLRLHLQDVALLFANLPQLRTLTINTVSLRLRHIDEHDLCGLGALLEGIGLLADAQVTRTIHEMVALLEHRRDGMLARRAEQQGPVSASAVDEGAPLRPRALEPPPFLESYCEVSSEYNQVLNTFADRMAHHVAYCAEGRLRSIGFHGDFPYLRFPCLTHLELHLNVYDDAYRGCQLPASLTHLSLAIGTFVGDNAADNLMHTLSQLQNLRTLKLRSSAAVRGSRPLPVLGNGRLEELYFAFPALCADVVTSLHNNATHLRRVSLCFNARGGAGHEVLQYISNHLAGQLEALSLWPLGPIRVDLETLNLAAFTRLQFLALLEMIYPQDPEELTRQLGQMPYLSHFSYYFLPPDSPYLHAGQLGDCDLSSAFRANTTFFSRQVQQVAGEYKWWSCAWV